MGNKINVNDGPPVVSTVFSAMQDIAGKTLKWGLIGGVVGAAGLAGLAVALPAAVVTLIPGVGIPVAAGVGTALMNGIGAGVVTSYVASAAAIGATWVGGAAAAAGGLFAASDIFESRDIKQARSDAKWHNAVARQQKLDSLRSAKMRQDQAFNNQAQALGYPMDVNPNTGLPSQDPGSRQMG